MLQLDSKNLSAQTQTVLNSLQIEINNLPSFADKVAKAQKLWNAKSNTIAREKAFEEITDQLVSMCVFNNVCNYCECNESNDIEHIEPKSFFPQKTFVWSNYLRACKQCNSAYKLDACFVLDDNDDIIKINRKIEPTQNVIAFINPRIENPADFFVVNLASYKFDIFPDLTKKDKNRANTTLEILQLNKRSTLLRDRKETAIFYYHRMDLLIKLLACPSIADMELLLTPYDNLIDNTQPLTKIKSSIKESFKQQISTYKHPSVWYAIKKVASQTNAKWKTIFQQLPEALNW